MTPHMPPFASLNKVGFRMSREPFVGVPGDPVRSKRIFFKIFDELDQMLPMTPHTPPFAAFQRSWFWEVSGTFRRGPWRPGEVETEFFFKIYHGLDQTLPMTPHTPPFAAFQKSRFREVSGTLRRGLWGPGEVETEFFSKFSTGLIRSFL